MIKYKVESNGRATNLQFCSDDYVAQENETIIEGDRLPEIETLHTQEYKDAQALIQYKEDRRAEYPDIGDQLDDLYHAGVFSADMIAKLKKVKDDNPKG